MSDAVADATLSLLEGHGPFMSDSDEVEIVRRMVESDDVADLALRTCMCGRRLEGFDDYFEHLRAVLGPPLQSLDQRERLPRMTTPHDPETDVVLGAEVAWTRRTTGTAIIAVRVPTELLAQIEEYGTGRGLTLSDVLRAGARRLIDESSSEPSAVSQR